MPHAEQGVGEWYQYKADYNTVQQRNSRRIPTPQCGIFRIPSAKRIANQCSGCQCQSECRQNSGDVKGHQNIDRSNFGGTYLTYNPDESDQASGKK